MTMKPSRMRSLLRIAWALALLSSALLVARPSLAAEGRATIEQQHNPDAVYNGYLIFEADVDAEGQATHIAWHDERTAETVLAYLDQTGYPEWLAQAHAGDGQHDLAQNAAEYIASQIERSVPADASEGAQGSVAGSSFAAGLARHLVSQGLPHTAQARAGTEFIGEQGYWLFVSDTGSIGATEEAGTSALWVAVGEAQADRVEKSALPTMTFEVLEDSTRQWGAAADANRQQSVPYRLIATLPDNFDAYDSYHCRFDIELPAGIELNRADDSELFDMVDVTMNDKTASPDARAMGVCYSDKTVTIDFYDLHADVWDAYELAAGSQVMVQFAVHLDDGATIGSPGNRAKAQLTYTCDPVTGSESASEPQYTTIYCWVLDILKTDEESDEALSGAAFTVQAMPDDTDSPTTPLYVQGDGSLASEAYEHTTDESGHVQVAGLDGGKYQIRETAAPNGYDKLDGDVTLVIDRTIADTDAAAQTLTATTTSKGAKVTGAKPDEGKADLTISDPKSKSPQTTVEASPQSPSTNEMLPQTGVAPFAEALIVIGFALLAAAVARGTLSGLDTRRAGSR